MDKILELLLKLKDHTGKIMWIPLIMSSTTFVANLIIAASDGVISDDEFHSLIQQSTGGQMVVLIAIMGLLKLKK
jgi:hypothetical protein